MATISDDLTNYTFRIPFGANVGNKLHSMALENFYSMDLEDFPDDGMFKDEHDLYSSVWLLPHSSLQQSKMDFARNEFQINFSIPSPIW